MQMERTGGASIGAPRGLEVAMSAPDATEQVVGVVDEEEGLPGVSHGEAFLERVFVAMRIAVYYCGGCGVRIQHEPKQVGYLFKCGSCGEEYVLAALRADLNREDEEHDALLKHLRRAQEEFLASRAAARAAVG